MRLLGLKKRVVLAKYFFTTNLITAFCVLITSLLRYFGYLWPNNCINKINNSKNALPKYFWNVLKNHTNEIYSIEIRIRRGLPYGWDKYQMSLDVPTGLVHSGQYDLAKEMRKSFLQQLCIQKKKSTMYTHCFLWLFLHLNFQWSVTNIDKKS